MDRRVDFVSCPSYDQVEEKVFKLLELQDFRPRLGSKVLVKPNWITFRQASLACTSPWVLRAVCLYLLEHGAQVSVGDSPAFGTAQRVARASGAYEALAELPVRFVRFTPGASLTLSSGVKVKLAREALETDLVVNVPKFKAHNQLLLTLAVKNLFGCVVGIQKPLLHARLGDKGLHFPEMLLEVAQHVPVRMNVVDAIVAMEGRGPTGGQERPLGLLISGRDPVAVDTAIYQALGLSPREVPLWQAAQAKGLPGAFPERLAVFGGREISFLLPPKLTPITFHPWHLARGFLKRLWAKVKS